MKPTKLSIPEVDEAELDEDGDDIDAEENDDSENPVKTLLVSEFIRMWPREIFHTKLEGQKGPIVNSIPELRKPGVYVLYRDDVPFYVGKTQNKLRSRLKTHANSLTSSKSYFWNYFSAYIVENPSHIDEVEAILISAMPSVITNSSKPKLPRVPMTEPIKKLMKKQWEKGQF